MTISRVRATINGVSGLPGLYTAYFDGASPTTTVAEANDVCGRVHGVWDAVKAYLASGVSVQVNPLVDTVDIATGDLLGRTSATTVPAVVNSSASGELPPFAMGGLRLLTDEVVSGRLLQGRSFIGPIAPVASNLGAPAAAFLTALGTAGAALASGASGLVNVVWARPTPGGTDGAVGVVTAYVGASKLWALRSRRD